ncbi:MAG: hypothetical protein AB1792_04675 [Candidatus Zixiibacteriota bacterium]
MCPHPSTDSTSPLLGPPGTKQRRLRILAVLLLLIIHLVLGAVRWDFIITFDGSEYLQMARNLLSTGSFTYDGTNPVVGKPPGFPFLLACYLRVVGSPTGFQHLQMLFLFATFLLVAAMASRVVGAGWALALLAVLVIGNPMPLLVYNLMSEPLFYLLTAVGISATCRLWESRRTRWALIAGLAYGLSAYVRASNLFWPLALLLMIVVAFRRFLRPTAMILVIHVVVVTPWLVRNAVLFHRFVPMVSNWGLLYYMSDAELYGILHLGGVADVMATATYKSIVRDECQFNWDPSERFRQAAMARIRSDLGGYLRRCLHQAGFAWAFIPGTRGAARDAPVLFQIGRLVMLTFYAMIIVGVFTLRRGSLFLPALLIGYAVYSAAVLFPVRTESRYLILPYMFLLPTALVGIRRVLVSRGRLSFLATESEWKSSGSSSGAMGPS